MADWYYSRTEDEREGPISEEQLQMWIDDGTLTARTLIWRDGMTDWQEVRRVFKATGSPQAVAAIPDGPPRDGVGDLPKGLQGWMLFIGIITILSGIPALCMLGLGILPILAGIHLLSARKLLDDVQITDPAWEQVLRKLRGYFMMLGLFMVIYFILLAILFFFNIGFSVLEGFGR